MIYYDKYENFLLSILAKMPYAKIEQLLLCLINNYQGMDRDLAMPIIFSLQKKGKIILSEDGWALTKSAYSRFSNDYYFDNFVYNKEYKLKEGESLILNGGGKVDDINCFWLIADMMPTSADFIQSGAPFSFSFEHLNYKTGTAKIYQIANIPKEKEDARCELIRSLPMVKTDEQRSSIVRIAIMDNEKHFWKVPHLGFHFVCTLDENEPKHFRIVEQRDKEDIWADYVK